MLFSHLFVPTRECDISTQVDVEPVIPIGNYLPWEKLVASTRLALEIVWINQPLVLEMSMLI